MIKPTATLTAIILCSISLAASVMLWASIPTSTTGQWLSGTIALGLEIAKFLFIPAGIATLAHSRITGIALITLGTLLLLVSVSATVGFLENSTTQNNHTATTNSAAYQTLQQKLNSIGQQINTYQQLTQTDADAAYRQRAYEQMQNITTLEQQRDATLAALNALQQQPNSNMAAMLTSAASALHIEPHTLQTYSYWLLALLIDIAGIAALLIATQKQPEQRHHTPSLSAALMPDKTPATNHEHTQAQHSQVSTPATTARPPAPPAPPATTTETTQDKIKRVARAIATGTYGTNPINVRNIIDGENVRHPIVKRAIEQLTTDNRIIKDGQRYQLTETNQ